MSYDDFDDYDDDVIDDTYPQPVPVQARLGDSELLLRRALDLVATAPNVPLSSTPRIDRDEIIEILEDAITRLPEELRQARWMLKEKQEFLDKTKREAEELLGAARQQAERMVQRTEVVRAAEQRARQVLEAADADARRLRNETEDFLDQRLGSFEILLDRLTKTVRSGRQRLAIGMQRSQEEEQQESAPRDQRVEGFFDQDQA
jgi:cell division septum initiation protein DivIVA